MHTEYEGRVLGVDPKKMIQKLEKVGADFLWDQLQKCYVYDFYPKKEKKWIRLRMNGSDTTLTIKNIETSKIDGAKELEIKVSDFEKIHFI